MVRIITDSASDFTLEEAEKYGLIILPMTITFGNESFRDRYEIGLDEFYDRLVAGSTLPITSQVTPTAFEEEYQKAKDAGDQVFVITMSSELSGTYQSACIAAQDFDNVYITDSLGVTVIEQCLIKYAMELRDKGYDAKQLKEAIDAAVPRVKVLALLDTLDYLKKGGRISPTVAFAGSLLSIKPAVTVKDGKVEIVGKARGSKNGNNLLMELIEKCGGIDFSKPIFLAYSGNDRTLLDRYIEDSRHIWEGNIEELPVSRIGSTIGTHVGPGAIAVAFFMNE